MAEKKTVIALAGNPNCGKTTLFNILTNGNQRVGNWPGVTVEKLEGPLKVGKTAGTVVDLPGIYSLTADSDDERAARDYLLSGEPSLVVNIIDSTNIERNLYLTTQIMEMGLPMLIVLNMADLAKKKGISIDLKAFEKDIDIPVIFIDANDKADTALLKKKIGEVVETASAVNKHRISYAPIIEETLSLWEDSLASLSSEMGSSSRWLALKLLEGDSWIRNKVVEAGSIPAEVIEERLSVIRKETEDDADMLMADSRYGFIGHICRDSVSRKKAKKTASERIDAVVMNRFLGIPIFLLAMFLVFWVTMSVGGAFIDFFDILAGTIFVDGFGALLNRIGSPEWLTVFVAGGLGGGIQTVATFVPIIFFMFLMLTLLEESGYMARAAFVMDRAMQFIGLPGKSFVPMLVGFGCTVPAIMATRTLESKRDRFMTIFMTPFMSCGARLPVYALFGAAFFGMYSGLIVFSVYMVGIVLAVLTGLLLKKSIFKGSFSPFVMELPEYHVPKFSRIMQNTWMRLKMFLIRAGKAITLVVFVLTILNTFSFDGTTGNEDSENSILATIGKTITPVFSPMGITEENWPATVGLFTGLFAKEAIVGTLNSLYLADSLEAETEEGFSFGGGIIEAFSTIGPNLRDSFGGFSDPLGTGVISADETTVAGDIDADILIFERMRSRFTPASAYAYLLFVLIYFPCIAALGAAIHETGRAYGTLLVSYLTLLAWCVATLFYQIAEGHSLVWMIVPVLFLGFIVASFKWMGRKRGKKIAAEAF